MEAEKGVRSGAELFQIICREKLVKVEEGQAALQSTRGSWQRVISSVRITFNTNKVNQKTTTLQHIFHFLSLKLYP